MSSINNNVTISGKYKLLWHSQPDSFSAYRLFMAKLGMSEELVYLNMNNIHAQVEDTMQDNVVLKFGSHWTTTQCIEVVKLGQMVEEPSFRQGGGVYSLVWYRYGNMMVKQARPSDKRDSPYTITREFTDSAMITTFSTDSNTLKVNMMSMYLHKFILSSSRPKLSTPECEKELSASSS